MWCTSLFQDLVTGVSERGRRRVDLLIIPPVTCRDADDCDATQTAVISNSSYTWEWWRAPPVQPMLKVYIFNYTNADSFGRDGQKLRVKEVGPFTYR